MGAWPANINCVMGNSRAGQGLQVEPSVVSATALQVSQRQEWWHAMANNGHRGPENSLHNGRMAPGHRSLNEELSNGSRATSRAPGRVRCGATAAAMVMKVEAIVARLDLVKINMCYLYHHTDSHKSGCDHCIAILTD